MKLSGKYAIRELAGRKLLVPVKVSDSSARTETGALRAITLSGSAFWMLKHFEGGEFSFDEAVAAVCDHYEADRAQVEADVASLVETICACGALENVC